MKVALKADANGRFVCADDHVRGQAAPERPLLANRDAVGAWETFELMMQDADGAWVPFAFPEPVPVPPQPPQPIPPQPTPPQTGDQIDFSKAVMTSGSPDVRNWPIGTTMTSIEIPAPSGEVMNPNFTKRNGSGAWPFIVGPEGGDIQYTLWIGCHIGGVWYFAGSILCISRSETDNYCPTGPTLTPGQLPQNWYYFAGSPLATYQPQTGEQVAWLVTSGVQRRNDLHVIAERSNVVLTPFQPGTWRW